MSGDNHTFFQDIAEEGAYPEDAILSKPLINTERLRVTLFALAAGQELTEHTTSMEAVLQILEGEVEMTVEGATYVAAAGSWLHMQPRVPHSLKAKAPAKFYLAILRS